MTRDDIPTPALLLDLDRFERNLRRMAAHARAAGKHLRPHAKTHRCPEIAQRQVTAGALGVACAKVGEAEVIARAGVRGLLITTEVVAPAAIRRLMRLVSAAPDTLLVVDNAANVADLGREAAADGVTLSVLVDVDVGNRRTGVAPGEPALALARAVAAQAALRFRGLQGYAGHWAHRAAGRLLLRHGHRLSTHRRTLGRDAHRLRDGPHGGRDRRQRADGRAGDGRRRPQGLLDRQALPT